MRTSYPRGRVVSPAESCENHREISTEEGCPWYPHDCLHPAPASSHRADHDRHHAGDLRHCAVCSWRSGRAADRTTDRHRCRRNGEVRRRRRRCRPRRPPGATPGDVSAPSKYRGAQGLDPEFIKSLEKQFGFDKPAYERFLMMIWDYFRFDFGESYFRDTSVLELIGETTTGVDLARALDDATVLRDLDSAWHPQGHAGRLALRCVDQHGDRHRLCHSGLPVRRVPHRALRRRIVLAHLPAARPGLGELGAAALARQDPRLFLAPGAAADRHVAVGLRHADLPHQELVPRGDPQAICDDRADEGADRRRCSMATSSATPC